MKTLLYAFTASALCCCMACNNGNQSKDSIDSAKQENKSIDSATMNGTKKDSLDDDKNFMVKAASGGLLEVALGKTALKNAASEKVKNFGQMMITDHSKANKELVALAKTKNIAVPSVPGNDEQEKIDKLQKEQGKDFDKDYVSMMIDDHKNDIKEFQDEVDNGKDPGIKALAQKTLPVLKKHLDHIQAIDSVMKK